MIESIKFSEELSQTGEIKFRIIDQDKKQVGQEYRDYEKKRAMEMFLRLSKVYNQDDNQSNG